MKTNALERLEEAVGLLRDLRSGEWLRYLLGALPFTLCVLLLVRDMDAGYNELCLRDSLLCTTAFAWGSFWKARFAQALFDRLAETDTEINRPWECALIQCILQGAKLVLLPIAAISLLPLPWFSVFFRHVSREANRPAIGFRNVVKAAGTLAAQNVWQTSLALLICAGGALVLFANVFVLVMMLPRLFQTFTGAENQWTRGSSGGQSINSFALAVAITWLAIDPVLQAYTAVQSFAFEARKNGRDLLVRLRRVAAAALLCCLLGGVSPKTAVAEERGNLSVEDVRRGVAQATESRDFAWVHRVAPKADSDDGFAKRILDDWEKVTDAIGSFFDWLGKQVDKLFGRNKESENPEHHEAAAKGGALRWTFYAGAALCLAVTAVLLFRRRKTKVVTSAAGEVPSAPAVTAEDVLATEKPQDEWLSLAREFASRGEWRAAIRMMYLANLSYLGAAEFLGITKSKSNAMYERELRNRCRTEAICTAFTRSNRDYERVWYGMHDVTPELRESFEQCVVTIRNHG